MNFSINKKLNKQNEFIIKKGNRANNANNKFKIELNELEKEIIFLTQKKLQVKNQTILIKNENINIDPTIMQALTEPILKLLDHKCEQIRKKAVIFLYTFYQVDKNSVPDCDERMRRLLCDFLLRLQHFLYERT